METNDVSGLKGALVVFLATLILVTMFGSIGTAAGTSRGVTDAAHAKDVAASSSGGTDSAVAPAHDADAAAGGTHTLGRCVLHIENASMVSPNELGVWVSATYPGSVGAHVPRYIAFAATINGKQVEKTFDVTPYTTPGGRLGKPSAPSGMTGNGNEMFEANGGLKPTTPLRINLAAEGVPRFTDNVHFTLTGTAFVGDGEARSEPSSIRVIIPLPAVIVEGLPCPLPRFSYGYSALGYYGVYNSLTDFMLNAGNGTFRYNKETTWNSYKTDLQARGYSTQQYVTFWDTYAASRNPPHIGYTTPQYATPDIIKADMNTIMRANVLPYSYASKCDLVGYSFGGLVARYYASIAPQNVSTVITIGAPYAGFAQMYEWSFSGYYKLQSRKDVEGMMSLPNTKTPNILWWVVPTYNCLVVPKYLPVNPYFNNTYSAPPARGVKYYCIYVDGDQALPTDDQLTISYVKDKNWYRITNITQDRGDVLVLSKSAASFGKQYPRQVVNQPLSIRCSHPYLLLNAQVQVRILRDLWM